MKGPLTTYEARLFDVPHDFKQRKRNPNLNPNEDVEYRELQDTHRNLIN